MRDMAYPHGSFRYKLEIDGMEAGGFSEVSGFDADAGLKKYGNITLKQGIVDTTVLFDWINSGMEGKVHRATLMITLQDQTETDVAVWKVSSAWPTKYKAPDFHAGSTEVVIETLEVAHEGMTRVM